MSFPRYPKYKTSGVEWLGEVPDHWQTTKLRHACQCLDGARVPLNAAERADKQGEVPYWGANSIVDFVDEALFDEDLVLLGEDGAPFFNRSKPVAFFSQGRVWPNNHVHVLRPTTAGTGAFIAHALNVTDYAQFIDGSTRDKLTQGSMNDIPLPWPPVAEQDSIASFLNRETAKIDALVAEQRRLIDLLKEKRQAVISHAVTKGLNPHAPVKPSGIEWLGDLPAHWDVISIKWLSTVKRGASPRPIDDPKYFNDQGEFAWVRIADVSACDGVLRETTQRLSDLGSSLSVKIAPGELFVSIAGTVGKPCLSAIKACIHDGFVYFPTLRIDPKFLYRIFEAGTCYGGLGKWGTQLNLNTDTIGSIRIALPPVEELGQVLVFLDTELTKLDTLTAEGERAIMLLEERRTALISAAVTGKIDVRGLVGTEAA